MFKVYDTNASKRFEFRFNSFYFSIDWWYNKLFRRNKYIPLEVRIWNLK